MSYTSVTGYTAGGNCTNDVTLCSNGYTCQNDTCCEIINSHYLFMLHCWYCMLNVYKKHRMEKNKIISFHFRIHLVTKKFINRTILIYVTWEAASRRPRATYGNERGLYNTSRLLLWEATPSQLQCLFAVLEDYLLLSTSTLSTLVVWLECRSWIQR